MLLEQEGMEKQSIVEDKLPPSTVEQAKLTVLTATPTQQHDAMFH